MTLHCLKPKILEAFISEMGATHADKPHGQSMYTFPNGLVVNVYQTKGTVTFAGKEIEGIEARQISNFISTVNAPFV